MEQNHRPDNFKKVEGSDFLHPFEFETKLKIHAEIKPPLNATSEKL